MFNKAQNRRWGWDVANYLWLKKKGKQSLFIRFHQRPFQIAKLKVCLAWINRLDIGSGAWPLAINSASGDITSNLELLEVRGEKGDRGRIKLPLDLPVHCCGHRSV